MKLSKFKFATVLPLAFVVGCASPDVEEDDGVLSDDNSEGEEVSSTDEALSNGCRVTSTIPTFRLGEISTTSHLVCPRAFGKLTIRAYLSRNGKTVAQASASCSHKATCSVTASASMIQINSLQTCGWGVGKVDKFAEMKGPKVCSVPRPL